MPPQPYRRSRRGAKLIVVDPRNAGLAHRADAWLQVRPGTDGALALGLAQVMIRRGWYDAAFLRAWTNAPMLVREDTGRLLRAGDIDAPGSGGCPGGMVGGGRRARSSASLAIRRRQRALRAFRRFRRRWAGHLSPGFSALVRALRKP